MDRSAILPGYKVYPIVADLEETIRIVHCWAHADRKFKDAKDPPAHVAQMHSLIAMLHEIDREVEGSFPGDSAAQEKRQALRSEKSGQVVHKIREAAFKFRGPASQCLRQGFEIPARPLGRPDPGPGSS